MEDCYDHIVQEILNHRELDVVLKKQLSIWMELINQEKELLKREIEQLKEALHERDTFNCRLDHDNK